MGRIRDDWGNLMSPTHAQKAGRRYRYYVSQAILQGRKAEAGSISRVPAAGVEDEVLQALRTAAPSGDGESVSADPIEALRTVVVRSDHLAIELEGMREAITVAWSPAPAQRRREIMLPNGHERASLRPIKVEDRARILRAITKARAWLDELIAGEVTSTDEIAFREDLSERSVRNLLGLALLSPEIVRAVIDGRLPRGIGLTALADLPENWDEQRSALGLASAS